MLPLVIGDIVGGAISAAFSGDEARIERMNNLDKEIERRVQPRANQLEKRAESLCRRMEALDAIDDALVYRLPDGSRLDLIDAKVKVRNDVPLTDLTSAPTRAWLDTGASPTARASPAGVFFGLACNGWRAVPRRPQ